MNLKKGNKKHSVWLSEFAWTEVESRYRRDNCSTRNEFIEKAIRFYSGYLDTESADAYLPRVLADVDVYKRQVDYELVDIFNWQEEAAGMISQMEFVRRVDVQTETIERYVRDGLLIPDLVVPMSDHRTFKYFKEETLQKYAQQFGWTLIDDSNRKDLFLDMVRQMDMSYSYKPVSYTHLDVYKRQMGLQAIICTPPDKLPDIMPLADRTHLVIKERYQMRVKAWGKEIMPG